MRRRGSARAVARREGGGGARGRGRGAGLIAGEAPRQVANLPFRARAGGEWKVCLACGTQSSIADRRVCSCGSFAAHSAANPPFARRDSRRMDDLRLRAGLRPPCAAPCRIGAARRWWQARGRWRREGVAGAVARRQGGGAARGRLQARRWWRARSRGAAAKSPIFHLMHGMVANGRFASHAAPNPPSPPAAAVHVEASPRMARRIRHLLCGIAPNGGFATYVRTRARPPLRRVAIGAADPTSRRGYPDPRRDAPAPDPATSLNPIDSPLEFDPIRHGSAAQAAASCCVQRKDLMTAHERSIWHPADSSCTSEMP
jgi:hypothetical protein